MEKIYNNLSIENLTKTEWFTQFDKNQQQVIIVGLEEKIDVSIYAKPEYNWEQMNEIRFGLLNNVNVSEYANSKYSWQEMRKIRIKLVEKSTL